MGLLFARLHEHGAEFVPPQGFTNRRMDSIYSRDEPSVLFSEACQDAFTPETKDILCQTDQRVKEAFAFLYSDLLGLQVIHNDLHHANIKLYRGHLFPIDFEDTLWGFPVQDIAMTLQDLMVDLSPEEYDPYQSTFQEGYERLQLWPESYEGQIDTFRVGRMLWVANYVARYQSTYLLEHVGWLARLFEGYLESGFVRRAQMCTSGTRQRRLDSSTRFEYIQRSPMILEEEIIRMSPLSQVSGIRLRSPIEDLQKKGGISCSQPFLAYL